MTPRQRQLAAIRHEVPDRVSVDVISNEIAPEIAAYLSIAPEGVPDRLGIDGRIVTASGYLGERRTGPGGEELTEWHTVNRGDYGSTRWAPLAGAGSVAEIEGFLWPDPSRYDFAEAGRRALLLGSQYAVRGPYWNPLFCRVCDLFGMEEAMVRTSCQPAAFEAALERVFAHTMEFCRRLLEACADSMPILCLGDDFATQRGLMISPQQWRDFLKPRYAKLFDMGKRRGKFIWFHSCGDITAVLPDLVEIGMDVWETVQLHTLPVSRAVLKREYGRQITFFGGVSTQRLPFLTPQQVREEVLHCIEALGKGGGYICGPDHHLKPDVPPQNAVALFETATAFRREGYTQGEG